MISIYNNTLADNAANSLSSHYSRLQISTGRLSSGLRINGSADDAAELAIRELMRTDVAAIHQGVRNANDAISMLQTFDGALAVIDEKLIRMKELAEQAATGTYDSTQRLIIDSEFQAMAAEIDRIARSTDFNGIKLLAGDAATGGDAEYELTATNGAIVNRWTSGSATQIGDWDTNGVANPGKLPATLNLSLTNDNVAMIGGKTLVVNGTIQPGQSLDVRYDPDAGWTVNGFTDANTGVFEGTAARINGQFRDTGFKLNDPVSGINVTVSIYDPNGGPNYMEGAATGRYTARTAPSFSASGDGKNYATTASANGSRLDIKVNLGNGNIVKGAFNVTGGDDRALSATSLTLKAAKEGGDPDGGDLAELFDDRIKIHFGTMNDSAEDYYYIFKHDATTEGLGLSGVNVKTQASAQDALIKINDAIVKKDEIRSDYGALQNRFENTITNLRVQAENLQTAEARISDADIAIEMSLFVKNQILAKSSTAMLAQANLVPQMVFRLIGEN